MANWFPLCYSRGQTCPDTAAVPTPSSRSSSSRPLRPSSLCSCCLQLSVAAARLLALSPRLLHSLRVLAQSAVAIVRTEQ